MSKKKAISLSAVLMLLFQLIIPGLSAFAAELLPTPTNVKATQYSPGNVRITWDKVLGSKQYNVYQLNGDERSLVSDSSYNYALLRNLAEGNYTFGVTAVNGTNESYLSDEMIVEVVYPEMQAPEGLNVTVFNGNDLSLRWNESKFAEGYNVYQVKEGVRTLLTSVEGNSYFLRDLPEGNYAFEVTAFNELYGESANSSNLEYTLVHPEMQPPELSLTVRNGNDLSLRWAEADYADSYSIYEVKEGVKELLNTTTSSSYYMSNLQEGKYTFEVTSTSKRFGESPTVSTINYNLIHPTMLAPEGLKLSILNGNDMLLRWDESEFANEYKIYKVTNEGRELLSTTQNTTAFLRNLAEGYYNLEVTSVSERFGESLNSSAIAHDLVHPTMLSPEGLKVYVYSGNDLSIRWNESEFADGYHVYQVKDGKRELLTITENTSYFLRNAAEGGYQFEVIAYSDRFGESEVPTVLEYGLVYPEITSPLSGKILIRNGNDLQLMWDEVEFASEYLIYQVADGKEEFVAKSTNKSYLVRNQPEGEYVFRIKTVSDRFGTSSDSLELQTTLVFPEVEVPKLSLYSFDGSKATVKWNRIDDAASYNVYKVVNGEYALLGSTKGYIFTTADLSDGQTEFVVTAVHERFGESEKSNSVIVETQYDTTAPETVSNVTDEWLNEDFTVVLTATDDESGVDKTFYSVNGSEYKEGTTFVVSAEGTTEVSFYSVDKAGNVEEAKTVQVKLDRTPPKTTSNVTGEWLNEDFTVALTATDELSGVDKTFYSINGSEYREGISFAITEEGIVEISFYSVDKAGNEEAVKTVEVKVDRTPPETVSNVSDEWLNEDFDVVLTATDNLSGVEQTFYSVNGSEYQEGTNFTVTEEGVNTISFYSVDKAGNEEEVQTAEVKIDRTAPETTSNASGEWLNGEFQVILEATDELSGVDKTYYAINDSEFVEGTTVAVSAEGITKVSFYSVDVAGNIEEAKTVEVKVDLTPPETASNATDEWLNEDFTVELTATDNLSGVDKTFYSVNGSEYQEGTSFVVSEEGVNAISFYSADAAGNVEEVKSAEVKIDKTAPVTTTNITGDWSKEDVAVTLTATDNLSGVEKTFYSVNGTEFKEGAEFTLTEEGIHTVEYYSVDAAGNIEEVVAAEVKIDKTLPTITTNFDDEYQLGTSIPLDYTAEDTISGVAKESVMINGQSFEGDSISFNEPGEHKVVIEVTDHAGWTTTVEKTYTVYVPATIIINPGVITENTGKFTVRVNLPAEFDTSGFDLTTATLDGVYANTGTNGLISQSKNGQFKYDREDFVWTAGMRTMEFRGMVNGYLVVGTDTVLVKERKKVENVEPKKEKNEEKIVKKAFKNLSQYKALGPKKKK